MTKEEFSDWLEHSGLDALKIKMGPLNAAISGNADSLVNAFIWGRTPQGSDYWSRVSRGRSGIPKDAMMFLTWLRDAETDLSLTKPSVDRDPDLEPIDRAKAALASLCELSANEWQDLISIAAPEDVKALRDWLNRKEKQDRIKTLEARIKELEEELEEVRLERNRALEMACCDG